MQDKRTQDPIMLGFGFGYLGICDSIVSRIKQMREKIKEDRGIDIPLVHIVDHDYDAEKNIIWLNENEYIIRVFGEEKERCLCDDIQSNNIVEDFKKVIYENFTRINCNI